jgi:hypothetical protein
MEKVDTSVLKAHWHAMQAQDVLGHFKSGPEGLSEEEALRQLGEYGANLIPAPKRRSPGSIWNR